MTYPVKDYMSKEIPTVYSEASAREASKTMAERHDRYLVVMRKTQLAGIVTDGDLVRKIMSMKRDLFYPL